MTGVHLYSTTAANNVNANTGVNWDEGMSPAQVNNSARQDMADLRTAFNDLVWFQYGKGDGPFSATYVSNSSFKFIGVDVTAAYHVGRRLKITGSSTGTIYATIATCVFGTDTGITFTGGTIANETIAVYLSQIPITGIPVSGPITFPAVCVPSLAQKVLDDYETLSWTPSYTASSGVPTYSSQLGTYCKIGRLVFVTYSLTISNVGTLSGNLFLAGLPFTVVNSNEFQSSGPVIWTSATTPLYQVTLSAVKNTKTAVIRCTAGAATTMQTLAASDLSNTTVITGSLTYYTAE